MRFEECTPAYFITRDEHPEICSEELNIKCFFRCRSAQDDVLRYPFLLLIAYLTQVVC